MYDYGHHFSVSIDLPDPFVIKFEPTSEGQFEAELTFGGEVAYQPCAGGECTHLDYPFSLKIHGIATAPVADAGATDAPDSAGAPADATPTKD